MQGSNFGEEKAPSIFLLFLYFIDFPLISESFFRELFWGLAGEILMFYFLKFYWFSFFFFYWANLSIFSIVFGRTNFFFAWL